MFLVIIDYFPMTALIASYATNISFTEIFKMLIKRSVTYLELLRYLSTIYRQFIGNYNTTQTPSCVLPVLSIIPFLLSDDISLSILRCETLSILAKDLAVT